MDKWVRVQYLPGTGLGPNQTRVTGSKEHIALSLEAAMEGMVLLKNEKQALPLAKGTRLALFGKGTFDYVKGGGGSGDVTVEYIRNLYEGFKELGDAYSIQEDLADFYRKNVAEQYANGREPGMTIEPEVPADLYQKAEAFTDTAVISISRFSGEGWDRQSSFDQKKRVAECGDLGVNDESMDLFPDGDFYLTPSEKKLVAEVTKRFAKVIVVLNIGGMMDTKWFGENDKIQGVLLALQGGMEGGLAAAKLLAGQATPSGKLTDTFATALEDYPSSENFHESDDFVDYTEDIYVGYRYFETIPGANQKVVYPFGYGLSYTKFALSKAVITPNADGFEVGLSVSNVGQFAGKEVVQVYVEAPQGKLGKPKKVLVGFAKTSLLKAGETTNISISVDRASFASYDDTGKVCESAYVLEAGKYYFYVGTSVRDVEKNEYVYEVDQDTVVEKLSKKMSPTQLKKRMLADGSFEELAQGTPNDPRANALEPLSDEDMEAFAPAHAFQSGWHLWRKNPEKIIVLQDVFEGKNTLKEFMDQLSDRQMAELLGGQPNTGVADTFGFGNILRYGIPNIMTADGPAGLRVRKGRGVCTTAWPCATLLACTWNKEMVERVGAAGGLEVKENNIGFWLTPAINIHRSPLCGRNFEYYSEDPFLTGKLASAMVRGIQSNRVGVSVKHFALNNKETNRKNSDSRASERAIREIYLKAFEIIVKEANPWTIMSSYNIINGHRASENKELLEDILRGEWNFQGIVTTDWWTMGEQYKELLAGNDIKMGCGYPDRLMEALEKGLITRNDLERSVERLLKVLMRVD